MPDFIKRLIIKVLNRWMRRSPLITRMLFGVKVRDRKRIHWDFTTIVLRDCLRKYAKPGHKILEIGTGSYAILAIYLAKRTQCDITATDITAEYLETARITAEFNNTDINFVHSDLFENIDGKFDLIFWNSVYIPRNVGINLGIDTISDNETDWCGGETGLESIEKFLQEAKNYLKDNSLILLGFNTVYISMDSVTRLCRENGYGITDIYHRTLNPSIVAVLCLK